MPAIISDIHGNLEALTAVLSQTEDRDVVCLGDIVCYGPDSTECVRRSASWKSVVAGPMDAAILKHDPDQWNPTLNGFIDRTRRRFIDATDSAGLFRTLQTYGPEYTCDGFLFFHGAPHNTHDWIFPEDIYCPSKLDRWVASQEHAFIGGGSHIPGIFRRSRDGWQFEEPQNDVPYELPRSEKTIITVGSVGQPRDKDPRAAYAILEHDTIVFRRVEYDLQTTIKKIRSDPDIDDMHGNRLPQGR